MILLRLRAFIVAVALTLLMTSCWPFKRSKPKAPAPAPIPAPAQTQPQTPPPQLPEPPKLPPGEQTPSPREEPPKPGPAPVPPPPQKRPSPAGPPVQPAPEPAPAPQLKPMLTSQQRQEMQRLVNQRIRRARSVLEGIQGRTLTRSQSIVADQIRTFIRQAEEAMPDDPVRASNLAERADVLARDLVQSIR